MRRSSVTLEWEAVGRAEGKVSEAQESLVRVLKVRFPEQVSVDVIQAIQNQPDLSILHGWLDRSAIVLSLEEFRQVAKIG